MFLQFIYPFTMMICGPSGCGKSTFIVNLLKNQHLISEKIDRIIWCFAEKDSLLNINNVEFIEGIPDEFNTNKNQSTLIILDDLMLESYSKKVCELFTKGSHHRNLAVILVTQNIFHKGAYSRDISLNSKYIVMFKNPRDKTQFQYLARQVYPENSKALLNVYNECTQQAHGYLLIDLTQQIHNALRFRTDIFNKNHYLIFASLNNVFKSEIIEGEQTYSLCS